MKPGVTRSATLGAARPLDRCGVDAAPGRSAAGLRRRAASAGQRRRADRRRLTYPLRCRRPCRPPERPPDRSSPAAARPPAADPRRAPRRSTLARRDPAPAAHPCQAAARPGHRRLALDLRRRADGRAQPRRRPASDVKRVSADGTGLSNPASTTGRRPREPAVPSHHPEVVVMVIGGNDGWNMTTPSGRPRQRRHGRLGRRVRPPGGRRSCRPTLNGGVQRRLLVRAARPLATDKWNGLYRKVNLAAAAGRAGHAEGAATSTSTGAPRSTATTRTTCRTAGTRDSTRGSPTASTGPSTARCCRRASCWPRCPRTSAARCADPGVSRRAPATVDAA